MGYGLSLAFSLAFLGGCGGDRNLEETLAMAGERRGEYERLIESFSDTPFHRRAVESLVSEMPFNHTLEGRTLDDYLEYYHLFAVKGWAALPEVDSLQTARGKFSPSSLRTRNDLKHLDLARLREDIGLAFRTREEMPWSANVTEEDFIRHVLPYRVGDERPFGWRGEALEMSRPVIDSLRKAGCDDPLAAARAIMRAWNRKPFQWTGQLPGGPALGAVNLTDKAGTCREFAHGVVYLMRAAGIPAGVDVVPIRGENSAGHLWPFIISKEGRPYVTCTENTDFVPAPEFDIVAAKIYRQKFGLNRRLDSSLPADRNGRPGFFTLPKLTDVTREYKPDGCGDVTIRDIAPGEGPLYLASWGNNRWVAVEVSKEEGEARFSDVSGGVISVAARMSEGELRPVCAPFEILDGNGGLRQIVPSGKRDVLTAFAKFPLNERNGDLVERCVGGVIEASDDPAFSVCDTVYKITELPKRRRTFAKARTLPEPRRYYRYRGADGTHCNIAEVALYEAGGDGKPIRGRVFGTPGAYNDDPAHGFDKVFDGDIFTSFDYKEASGGWAAMDAGRPVTVDRVMYVPRNRDNFVREGDDYELFWFGDCRWNSAGRMTATSDSLDFEVPVGTLYYLRNYSRGRSERIFEYDFSRRTQRFW